jgi:hypothetical protein
LRGSVRFEGDQVGQVAAGDGGPNGRGEFHVTMYS